MTRKTAFVWALLLCCTCAVTGQRSVKDSLLRLLPASGGDSNTLKLYIRIAEEYKQENRQQARGYYRKAIALGREIHDNKGTIKALTRYAGACNEVGEFDSLIWYARQALELSRISNDSLNMGISLFNIALGQSSLNDDEAAVASCLESLQMIPHGAPSVIELQLNDGLQVIYLSMNRYDKAITYGLKAVALARQLHQEALLAQALSNLSMSYTGTGQYHKASPLLEEALTITLRQNYLPLEASIRLNLADICLATGDMPCVKTHSERSLQLSRQLGALQQEVTASRAMAVYHLQQKNFSRAQEYIDRAITIARQQHYTQEYAASLKILSNIRYAQGNVAEGQRYYQQSEQLLTGLIQGIVSEKSAALEKKYETALKETQIKELKAAQAIQLLSIKNKNMLITLLLIAAVAALITGLLLYRNYRNKQKIQQQRVTELETAAQLAATEAVLQGEERERGRMAKDLHDGLGGMLSGVKFSLHSMRSNLVMTSDNAVAFERSLDMLDSSINEMRRIAHNMLPEALIRYGLDTALQGLCNDISSSWPLEVRYSSIGLENLQLEQTKAITLYRIVQELLNNSLKHAQAHKAIVQLTRIENQLSLTVEDDGSGFDPQQLTTTRGMGWTNIQNRVYLLNGKLDIDSGKGRGTSVFIEIAL